MYSPVNLNMVKTPFIYQLMKYFKTLLKYFYFRSTQKTLYMENGHKTDAQRQQLAKDETGDLDLSLLHCVLLAVHIIHGIR